MAAGKLITVAETPLFVRQAEAVWDDDERIEFVTFIAANPEAGDVIAGTGGVRKVPGRAREPASAAVFGSSISTTMPTGPCTS